MKKGFLLAFCLNLIFRGEWLVWAIIALIGHYLLAVPIIIVYIFLGAWILISLFVTLVLGWASGCDSPTPKRKNINPYSKKTDDFLSNK